MLEELRSRIGGLRTRSGIDLTGGPLLSGVLRYSLPLLLTGVLNLLYNAADIVVVGNFAGAQALAAVGSTSSLINLLTNLFIGVSVGASVYIARCHGARDTEALSGGVHTAMTLALFLGFGVAVLGVAAARPLLELMGSPEDVIDSAALYVRIYFAGSPFNMLYLFGAAILRAVGDTRRPLYYLTLAGLINVALNLLLVIVFRLAVAGVAIATITSQAVSMLLVVRCLMNADGPIRLKPRSLGLRKTAVREMLVTGLPAGLQASLFSLSNVLIQSAVNSFGSTVMAGNAAASNLEGFVYTAMNTMQQSAMTFASANMGARKYTRVRRTLWVCLGTVTAVGLGFGLLVLACGRPLLSVYNSDPEVIAYGLIRLGVFMPVYFLCGIMDTMVGQLRGIGHSVMPMIVSLTGACLLRMVWLATVFAADPTLNTLYLSYPVSWIVTGTVHMLCYAAVQRRLPRTDTL